MTTNAQRFPSWLILTIVFALGGLASWYYFKPTSKPIEESTVLLERIRSVCKLVTVEGDFSEVFSHSEYQGYFTFFWDKRMLLRVQATVAAGYDFEKAKFEADPVTKTIRISQLPEASILSIDHKVDYYDISEGVFTAFAPEDYTRINDRAKELIREQANKSNLLPSARAQAGKVFELVRFMVESSGWKLVVDGPVPLPN
jgi:hypothetical protein